MSNENQRPMYFSQIRVDPNNPDVVYLGGVGPTKSVDGGKTWQGLNNMGHVDNHAIWIDPLNSKHVMYGNDGGIDVTWDAGAKWEAVRMWAVGLAYHASADMRHPYNVCTGLQDNGSWCGPSSVRDERRHPPVDVDPRRRRRRLPEPDRSDGLTTSSIQNLRTPASSGTTSPPARRGASSRTSAAVAVVVVAAVAVAASRVAKRRRAAATRRGGRGNIINPIAGATVQFNWNTPIRLSPHNPSTIYARRPLAVHLARPRQQLDDDQGARQGHRSQRAADHGRAVLAAELCGRGGGAGRASACILSKNDGYVANEFGTMTEMAESPIMPGILWAGTDDGNVQVSRDGGYTWEEVGKNVPGVNHEYYVSGLEASWYDAGTAYSRSTATGTTTSSRTSSRPPTTARRGRRSPAICRRSAT